MWEYKFFFLLTQNYEAKMKNLWNPWYRASKPFRQSIPILQPRIKTTSYALFNNFIGILCESYYSNSYKRTLINEEERSRIQGVDNELNAFIYFLGWLAHSHSQATIIHVQLN